jgi:hypothetical protein
MQFIENAKRKDFVQCSLASLEARRRRSHQYRRPRMAATATRTPVEQTLLAIDRLAD